MVMTLQAANTLGQEVTSTSAGSIYICCMISESFKVAVRNNGNTLSVRVEPTGEKHFSETMWKTLGFGGANPTNYLSQHLLCEGGPLALCGVYGALVEQVIFMFKDEAVTWLHWAALANAGK